MPEAAAAILAELKEIKQDSAETNKSISEIKHRLDLIDNNTNRFNEDKWTPLIKNVEKIGSSVEDTGKEIHRVRSDILTLHGQFNNVEHRMSAAEKRITVLEEKSVDAGTRQEVLNSRVLIVIAIAAWVGTQLFDRLYSKPSQPSAPPVIYIVPQKPDGSAGEIPRAQP